MSSVSIHITADADDGEQVVGVGIASGDPVTSGWTGFFNTELIGFLRFLSVGVPVGTTITAATITLNVVGITGTPDTTIYGVDADNASAFADPGNLPSNATPTTASYDADPAGTGTFVLTVTDIVAEIVARAGWASGNNIAFIIRDNFGSGSNNWSAEDYHDAGTAEAVLDVTYTAGGGGSTPAQAQMRNFRGIEPGAQIGGQ